MFRLVSDHLHRRQTVYDERFAREYGPWRPVVAQVADKFFACGVLERGFARIRRDGCAHEYLLAFSCECRYFCPSCHAKRLAIWTHWLDTTLLAPVPHRQVVLTIPKRLRASWCSDPDIVAPDASAAPSRTAPPMSVARLTGAFRRAVLRLFVRLHLFDEDQAGGKLTWPHSGFHVHTAVWVPEDDRVFATRLARYCARNPVALERLTYDRAPKVVSYRSNKSEGDSGERDRRPAGDSGAGVGPHPRQRPCHHAVLRLVRQPPPGHAGEGGACGSGRAADDGVRAATRADRGHAPVGDAAPADL